MSLVLAVITLGTPAQSSEPRVVCYYTNWSVYRPGTAKFNPQNINPYLCTHLIYAFGGFTKENTLKPFDKYQDIEKGGYAKFTGLKTYNKNLKTLLAIGGWNEGSSRFSPMVASRERRREFVRNAIKFLRQNRFDGLDLDWEYPAARDGSKPKDRENYAKLVKELREEFERESQKTGKPRLLLTMAVPAGIDHIKKGFDVKTLNQYLDWMNLLTYDYHSAFEPAVNHHAPLYPLEEPNEYSVDNELNIDYTIKFYIENGADPDKLVLGIPTYGRSYTLFNPEAVEIGAPADGPGEQGDATREKGYLAYYEICEALKPKQRKRSIDDDEDEESEESESTEVDLPWTVMNPNPNAMGPVAYRGNQWVGYDDIEMVKKKAEYVAENGLGGIMFWSVDNDDFRGNCHGKPYPLIEAAKEAYIVKLGATDNAIVTDKPQSITRGSSKRRNRPRSTTTTTTTAKPSTAAKTISSKRKSGSSYTSTTPAWNIITPEPPTTPDPGADFKCTDEGFFQHPRDCKKYFWCLDSGPSNLGIVAHQFTCPSGLFFNKAADSCDFARNVLCKKPSATTKATTRAATTKAATTSTSTTTTTRRPIKLSTKNSVLFRTTTTTTTPAPESEEEYEDELEDAADIEAEDPKVIKELIDLIKKVGGVEQLEKHLRLSETSASTDGAPSITTPSSLNKKLYKVLERTRGKNKFGSNSATEESSNSNSRRGPQNAGLESSADKNVLLRKDKPQYTTINRFRPSTSTTQQPDGDEEVEDGSSKNTRPESRARVAEPEVSTGTTSKTLQYVNIRRARPTYTSDTADDTASRNALFERAEPYVTIAETPSSLDILSARRENTPEYVTIRRQRPSTEETTPQYQNTELDDELQGTALEREISSQPQYTSIVRARSTTLPPPEGLANPEPTTILAVQISSLLNSPSPTEAETLETETEAPPTDETDPTTIIITSTSTTTQTTTTTTTEGPSVFLASTGTPRQIPLRRRGSTTLAPFTSSQVSPRNYSFISRRRPLAGRNEISSDSDETNEISRKIRSTTPNSREASDDKANIEGTIRQIRRKRVRVRPVQNEDSIVAAASPISRGQFRPQISPDEVVSLTPLENETPQFVQRPSFTQRTERRFRPRTSTTVAEKVGQISIDEVVSLLPVDNETPQFVQRQSYNQRLDRRFRPRTSTTVADRVDDSEVSAATVDVRRPSFASRGRSRFTVSSSTIANEPDPSTTEAILVQRRPTFARVSPRPFAKRPEPSSDDIAIEPDNEIKNTVTQRIPPRISFGRTRPASSALNSIQGRKLPFPLTRSQTTTQQALTPSTEEEDIEGKHDDISLSESAIEEKEHEENNEAIEEAPKRRIVIKKLRTTAGSSENISTETIPINDSGKKRIKVIRRLPTSTTVAADSSTIITESPTSVVPRRRKIIRKIIRLNEAEPEIVAKSVGSLNSVRKDFTTEAIINYGEKTRPTLIPSLTPSTTDSLKQDAEEQIREFISEIVKVESNTDLQENVNTKSENNTVSSAENDEDKSPINTVSDVEPENNDTKSTETKSQLSDDKLNEAPEIVNLEKINTEISDEPKSEHTEGDNKPQVVIENKQKSVDISEIETLIEETTTDAEETLGTTTTTTTQATPPSPRTRVPYRPSKRLFSSSTEPSVPSSSKFFSRKYNPGVYTSPASADKELLRPSSTRRPLFTPRSVARRPYTTARTTPKVQEEEEYSEEEEILNESEEPENKLVFVPAGELYPRTSSLKPATEDEEEYESEEEPEDEPEEEQVHNKFTTTSKKPTYNKPRVVNSNTFRSSSTTESSQKPVSATQNRTAVLSRFSQNKPVDDTKKRVQNVPVGYNIPVAPTVNVQNKTQMDTDETTNKISVTISDVETEMATVDDDYLSMTEATSVTSENTADVTSTNVLDNETTTYGTMETNADTDDYLEYTGSTTNYPSTQYFTYNTETDSVTNSNNEVTADSSPETTTNSAQAAPIVKTQFNKLFSVSRVVEVNSKLDKHRLNKNNETTLVEEGKIMIEKKPVVDKIGEVSRFSFIKIVEDDIPIYLTKLGHVYPVENLPDNLIRIDEARNARALSNFADAPKENLVASESINEGYRHVKQSDRDIQAKGRIEHIPGDDFLSYINEDKKSDKLEDLPYPSRWQFVPAAFESDKEDQPKAARSFEIITPRSMLTDPSTLSLEALFKTERPQTARKTNDDKGNQPFVVYSASLPTQKEEGNLVKLQVIKPETGRSIITFAKGQEFNGGSVIDESTIKYPVSISVLPKTSESTSTTVLTTTPSATESVPTSPIVELLTTTQSTTLSSESPTTTITTEIPTTTETVPEETTTQKSSPLDAKRSKFAFPRRPIIKPSNITRPIPRTIKKLNATALNSSFKPNKTSGFVPNKSRFTVNRGQNVPVDGRKSTPKAKTFSTESPRTTTERKLFFKPIRPAFRPAFVPRKSLTTTPATTEDT